MTDDVSVINDVFGKRYWLMSRIGEADRESMQRKAFGGLQIADQTEAVISR
jgi:hypothetical protein